MYEDRYFKETEIDDGKWILLLEILLFDNFEMFVGFENRLKGALSFDLA